MISIYDKVEENLEMSFAEKESARIVAVTDEALCPDT
jgi:hypothetical protein